MKKILAYTIFYLIRFSLWFRYSVTIKGFENLDPKILNKPCGVLFLPNHPTVFVDPTLVALAIWKKYPVRPIIVEYMYYTPVIHWLMRFMNAIPVPTFVTTSNSLKKKKAEKVFETMIADLKKGDDFLIYPAGKIKHQAREVINGSGVHKIVQAVPDVNIVLVRTTGLWGSSFSRALTGTTPFIFTTIFRGMWIALKNLVFFTPRRRVTIEFQAAGPDFPYHGSRVEFNRYLEKWYNRPDGILPSKGKEPGESLYIVPYSIWSRKLPQVERTLGSEIEEYNLEKIPEEIKQKILTKLSEISQTPVDQITPEMYLGKDLGLDSLDNAEVLSYLDDTFDISGVPVGELSTVSKLMAIVDQQVTFEEDEEMIKDLSKWNHPIKQHEKVILSSGETIPEVFLNTCHRMGHAVACGDLRSGISTYAQAKMRVIILAEYIRQLPGEYIGILLPSSVAAYFSILACLLAGKIPLMINWTVGPRHLETVVALSKVEVVLSSWAFLDKLENVDLNGVDDKILMLEDVRRSFSLLDKVKGFYRSKLSTEAILNLFNVSEKAKSDQAVLLFTSGTESMPKGVPLTHENILSNQRAATQLIDIFTDDVLLGVLPPFHAFGFTVSGLLPLLGGLRVAYYPDPTDGPGLAKSVERWKATVICGTPAFLKGMFKNGDQDHLSSLRLCVTGAEKAPPELFEMAKQHHCKVIEGYGITECSPILTVNQSDPTKGVGQALPGVDMKVIDLDTRHILPIGKTGLILTRGPNIFSGYLNKGIASPFVFVNGLQWYSTGDLGYLDEFGNLYISGRLKRFVKMGGEMISLGAIEEALTQYLGEKVKRLQEEGPTLAISAKEEPGERAKLFLFSRFPLSIEEANRALRESGFSNLVKIYQTEEIAEIPLMGTGKINYRALEARLPKMDNNKETVAKGL